MTLREAAQLALDALHLWHWTKQTTGLDAAHDALRDAILEPDHTEDHLEMVKPVAWMLVNTYGEADDITYEDPMGDLPEGWTCRPLYTAPPQRKPLSDGEITALVLEWWCPTMVTAKDRKFARAIESAHGIGGKE